MPLFAGVQLATGLVGIGLMNLGQSMVKSSADKGDKFRDLIKDIQASLKDVYQCLFAASLHLADAAQRSGKAEKENNEAWSEMNVAKWEILFPLAADLHVEFMRRRL